MEYLYFAGDDRFGALGDGEQWLLKFFNGDPIDSPLVEHATMTLASQAGIRVAEMHVIPLLGQSAVAVRRFDRAEGQRIHAISAGTALRATVVSGQGLQEFICGDMGRDSTLENAMSQCQSFGLAPPEAAAQVAQVIEVVDTWRRHFASCGVTDSDIARLAETIDGEDLLRQRRGFDAASYPPAPPRRARRGPFSR